MQNEVYKKKIRQTAGISSIILMVYTLLPLYVCITNFYAGFMAGYESSDEPQGSVLWELSGLVFQLVAVVAGILAIINSLRLLMSIRKDETPFTLENGAKIRRTGILLMLIEPLFLLSKLVTGEELHGIYGITFVVGLIMYNVSLLFAYGAHLQQESDETL